jgi:hypothetical protein
MNKIQFVDMVVMLHDIAKTVDEEIGRSDLSDDIRNCADRLHVLAQGVRLAEVKTNTIIDKAKE